MLPRRIQIEHGRTWVLRSVERATSGDAWLVTAWDPAHETCAGVLHPDSPRSPTLGGEHHSGHAVVRSSAALADVPKALLDAAIAEFLATPTHLRMTTMETME